MSLDPNFLLTITLFFLVAVFYSSAGFGGGSSYLAILALIGFDQYMTRTTALCCNLAVVVLSVIQFNKNDLLPSRKAGVMSLFSIPAAFFAAQFKLQEKYFFLLLSVMLLLSAISLFFSPKIKESEVKGFRERSFIIPVLVGIFIGFIAGLVGIGGGVFLAPLLYFFNYEKPKKIAAIASFFILVNSVAGLLGLAQSGQLIFDQNLVVLLVIVVLLGGYLGNKAIVNYLKPLIVKKITAFLLFLIAIRLLYKYIPGLF